MSGRPDATGRTPRRRLVLASSSPSRLSVLRSAGVEPLVVVPGTRATLDDLAWLRARGLDRAVTTHVERGGAVLGICGGFQMLGGEITDPDGETTTIRFDAVKTDTDFPASSLELNAPAGTTVSRPLEPGAK